MDTTNIEAMVTNGELHIHLSREYVADLIRKNMFVDGEPIDYKIDCDAAMVRVPINK